MHFSSVVKLSWSFNFIILIKGRRDVDIAVAVVGSVAIIIVLLLAVVVVLAGNSGGDCSICFNYGKIGCFSL